MEEHITTLESAKTLEEWVNFGDILPEIILTEQAKTTQNKESWYDDMIKTLFNYATSKNINYDQIATMTYAALSKHLRPATSSASGGNSADAPMYFDALIGDNFKLGNHQSDQDILKSPRIKIWNAMLKHTLSQDSNIAQKERRAIADNKAQQLSHAIFRTEVRLKSSPVELEHITRSFVLFIFVLDAELMKKIIMQPWNWENNAYRQAVQSYYEFDLDEDKRNKRPHEVCVIIEQAYKWEKHIEFSQIKKDITTFWEQCKGHEGSIYRKNMKDEELKAINQEMQNRRPHDDSPAGNEKTGESAHAAKSDEAVIEDVPDAHEKTAQLSHEPDSDEKVTAVVVHHTPKTPQQIETTLHGGNEQQIEDQTAILNLGFNFAYIQAIVNKLDQKTKTGLTTLLQKATTQEKIERFRLKLYEQIQLYIMQQNPLSFDFLVSQSTHKKVTLLVDKKDTQIKIYVKISTLTRDGDNNEKWDDTTYEVQQKSIKLSNVDTTKKTCEVNFIFLSPGLVYGVKESAPENIPTELSPNLCALLLCINPEQNTSFFDTALAQVPRQYQINYL